MDNPSCIVGVLFSCICTQIVAHVLICKVNIQMQISVIVKLIAEKLFFFCLSAMVTVVSNGYRVVRPQTCCYCSSCYWKP